MEADPGNLSDSHDGNDTDECEFDTVPVEEMTEERALPEAEAALAQETWKVLFLQTYGSSLLCFMVALCMLTGLLFITGCWMVKEAWKSFAFCRTLVHLWALIASIAVFFVFLVPLHVLMCRWQLRGRFLHLSGALICATGLWDLFGSLLGVGRLMQGGAGEFDDCGVHVCSCQSCVAHVLDCQHCWSLSRTLLYVACWDTSRWCVSISRSSRETRRWSRLRTGKNCVLQHMSLEFSRITRSCKNQPLWSCIPQALLVSVGARGQELPSVSRGSGRQ